MSRHVVQSWLVLLYCDWLMCFRGFQRIHAVVREQRLHIMANPQTSQRGLSDAIDLACVFYFKRVLCLQRSAAMAILLRRHGWSAEMVIGAQLLPFHSHAWVEINGQVVNDKPYIAEIFQVLERC
jgi:hypothetical protein